MHNKNTTICRILLHVIAKRRQSAMTTAYNIFIGNYYNKIQTQRAWIRLCLLVYVFTSM